MNTITSNYKNKQNQSQSDKNQTDIAFQIYMDNYELSGEAYAAFKLKFGKDKGWVHFMDFMSKVNVADSDSFKRRLQKTGVVRIHFFSTQAQAVLNYIPMQEEIKHLDLAYNNINGGFDLSHFTQLKTINLSGNPDLDISKLILPPSVNHIILTPLKSEQAVVLRKHFQELSFSQNGNPEFTLGSRSFREPETVAVIGGKFLMGSPENDEEAAALEKPQHPVQITDFAIGKYQITVGEFAIFVEETGYVTTAEQEHWSLSGAHKGEKSEVFCAIGCHWRHDAYGQPMDNSFAHHPVINVTWEDANAYCNWLSQKTGKNYQLPTEAQWEYASMGGHLAPQNEAGFHYRKHPYAGSSNLKEVGWYNDNFEGQEPWNYSFQKVGQLKPNELGMYDCCGNVREWCMDSFDPEFYQKCLVQGLVMNPISTEQAHQRVLRGGGWGLDATANRLANRRKSLIKDRGDAAGFRVVQVS